MFIYLYFGAKLFTQQKIVHFTNNTNFFFCNLNIQTYKYMYVIMFLNTYLPTNTCDSQKNSIQHCIPHICC